LDFARFVEENSEVGFNAAAPGLEERGALQAVTEPRAQKTAGRNQWGIFIGAALQSGENPGGAKG
jgi:hypothetical protein